MTPLLSTFYFGSVEHYRLLAHHPKAIIDGGEHHVRQSYRTRTGIVGPNGAQALSVHVEHTGGTKIPVRDVRLSCSEPWHRQHLHAIRSAYGNTPWFIHYIDDIEAVLLAGHTHLIDLNRASLAAGMRWLGIGTAIEEAAHHVEDVEGLLDLRDRLHPKKPLPEEVAHVRPYPQVFADRHGFVPRRSVIDLVCNCGPEARHHLGAAS